MKVFKKFIKYYKPYKFLFFTDMICALIVCLVDLSFPIILSYLSKNFFIKDRDTVLTGIIYIAVGLAIMYVAKYFCQYFIASWGHIMGARMETDMRQDLFYHLQMLPFSYYDENNTGEMMSKLVSDLFDISELAHHGPENVFISALKILGSFVILMMINVKMTFILFVVTLIMVIFSINRNTKMQKIFFDNRKKIANVNSSVQDSLEGIRVVKSFANESVEQKKFDVSNNNYLKSKVKSYKAMGEFIAGSSLFQGMLYLSIIVSGAVFIKDGTLKISDLAIYALYINIFINPIDVLINFMEQFQKGYAGFKRFIEVVETKPSILDKPGAEEIKNVKGNIKFKDVCFKYDDAHEVIHNLNINIDAGKTVALVGPSGGGKTTICSLLPRFYDVTSGSITIDDNDIRDVTLNSLRNAIGVVQQDVYIFSGTIRDNIAYGRPEASEEEVIEAAKGANIHDYIMSLEDGYDTFVGERGVKLSGGQKQRISIARVFLKNPPILILDEATSALDNESEKYIQKSLEKLSSGRTSIVIAHRLSTIRNADEIIVIKDRGIKEKGNHEELLKKGGVYSYYYNMQFEGLNA
ncbi:ATP-binding cassette subfamily B protein [Clostridium acetobutylicum]|uniref:ABC-type multidrug/protein/lipid transport system, membrane ATPase component n=1 Tax=Clostridium acetobutylicum (strain ATCC 824 / DSM 792 / JCM 1419 / IAM 19013 / LMG 5710 / NBRC 13948 / NRRL B-527 / VKM B-1787 / 2291 / W) TaxID=272562 RepID=Q97IM7_CLOAB|nr:MULTISPECIES: ABC transporter ATP-binding protein [Clostridium]AAK79580.1 ABC-type multidrug/protein/lipid transport system, membrane ATPase component [Clostridium acetobutylicum ATCC 824]ADZ20664.1 BC-type multidrug/protein/lipid transport system, membrane ATPase component [Clostridium acetobutylicum EA 2018]AEI33060.1 ABC-type multidrug/protein/lipid transport system, membrane ATPase component [Clostridium acetobutylicum DSM 1731]AWV79981.1 ABC transporter ATP-binding protein [Clostridium 